MKMTRRQVLKYGAAAAVLSGGRSWGDGAVGGSPVGVVVGADIHLISREPQSGRAFALFVEDVNENLPNAQHVLLLGDLVNVGRREDLELLAELQSGFRPQVHGVPGNHDFDVPVQGEKRAVLSDGGSLEQFCAILGYSPTPFYSFHIGNVRFVMLATQRMKENPPEISWGGWMAEDQATWLRGELMDANRTGDNVILCSHHGIRDTCWNTGTPQYSLNPPERVRRALARYPVDLSFSGHVHGVLQEHHDAMFAGIDGTLYINGGALSHSRNGRMQSRYFELVEGATELVIRSRDHVDMRDGPEADHPTRCFDPELDVVAPLRYPVILGR